MLFHRRDDHFGRKFQKVGVETTDECGRVLRDRDHLFEQFLIDIDLNPFLFLQRLELPEDTFSALICVKNDTVFFQQPKIFFRGFERKRRVPFRAMYMGRFL